MAAPTPWATRAESICPSVWAMPPSSEASANTATPTMKTLRRPSRSPARPPSSSRPPKASVYALTTQDRFAGVKSRSVWMCGRAMFTIVPSRTTMSCAALISVSARPRRRCAPGMVSGGVAPDVVVVAMGSPGRVRCARSGCVGLDGREDDGVHDPGDELASGLLAAQEDAVQDDAGQHVEDQVEVDVGAQLAAGTGPLEQLARRPQPGPQERLLEGSGEVGVVVQGGDQGGHQLDRQLVEQAARATGGREQVAAQRPCLRWGTGEAAVRTVNGVHDQPRLAAPAPVQGGLAGVRGRRDAVHRESVVAGLAEQDERGVEDLCLALALDPRACGWGGTRGSALTGRPQRHPTPPRSADGTEPFR